LGTRAAFRYSREPDASAVSLDDRANDEEPEAEPAFRRILTAGAPELLE
jgi:hypothetical protein